MTKESLDPATIEWWREEYEPGTRRALGVERRIASYLYRNVPQGGTFTTRDLREAIKTEGKPNTHEHFQRRLRALREDGWILYTQREMANLGAEQYQVHQTGWAPELGPRAKRNAISNSLRTAVFERDGYVCQLCGERAGDSYADSPNSIVRLTVGHIQANAHGGSTELANLRAECSRCNETKRDEGRTPELVDSIWSTAVKLSQKDKADLLSWLESGSRPKSKVEQLYVRTRLLGLEDRNEVIERLGQAVRR